MQSSDIPEKFPIPFADDAGPTYSRAIPVTTANPVEASLELGFPPNTFVPLGAGGTPPDGRDFNGILNMATAWLRWQAAGGPIAYSASFQTLIGGYPAGAMVASAVTIGLFWISTVENNVTDPDAGGAGWAAFPKGPTVQVFTSSATWAKPAGLKAVIVEVIGGGGGSGGTPATSGSQAAASTGGAGAGYSRKLIAASALASTESVTVGAGGAAGTASPGAGGMGGTSSFGAHCQATGGTGSSAGSVSTGDAPIGAATAGGLGSGGDINIEGARGMPGLRFGTAGYALGGIGGNGVYGAITSADSAGPGSGSSGNAGRNYGGGASGNGAGSSAPAAVGYQGGQGIVIVTMFF